MDFNQNAPHKTVFGAWFARPRTGGQVSTPLTWEEVETVVPNDLTIRTVPDLVRRRGDPWADIAAAPQSIEPLLALAERDKEAGLHDAPWPPQYPKMPDEPPRVAPSRAKKDLRQWSRSTRSTASPSSSSAAAPTPTRCGPSATPRAPSARLDPESWPRWPRPGGCRASTASASRRRRSSPRRSRGEVPDYLTKLEETPDDLVLDGPARSSWTSLRGDCHSHSDWSDGGSPIREMAEAARALGHEYLVLTDHSARLTVAHGLNAERLAGPARRAWPS